MIIEECFPLHVPEGKADLCRQLWDFHLDNVHLIDWSKGSNFKHQAWKGGYRDHIEQCIQIADKLYNTLPSLTFSFWDVFVVLYLHDIEKIWKYTTGEEINKEEILSSFSLTDQQRIAIKYIHGEGDDYGEERVMNELGAFCHCCDILSARVYYNQKKLFLS